MTKRQRSSQPDRPRPGRSLDALLAGGPLADRGRRTDGDVRWEPVAQVLTALTSAPESSELTGEAPALAEFRALAESRARGFRTPGPARPARVPRRDPGRVTTLRRSSLLGARPAVAATAGAVLVGGLLAVAYAGDLPAAAQRLAHDTIDAPAAGRPASAGVEEVKSSRPAGRRSAPEGRGDRRAGHEPDRPVGGTRSGHVPGSPSGGASGSPSGSPSGYPSHHRPSSSPPATPGGPDQSGNPSGSPAPSPTQQPSASASIAPSAGPTPSPSTAFSPDRRARHHHRQRSRAAPQSATP